MKRDAIFLFLSLPHSKVCPTVWLSRLHLRHRHTDTDTCKANACETLCINGNWTNAFPSPKVHSYHSFSPVCLWERKENLAMQPMHFPFLLPSSSSLFVFYSQLTSWSIARRVLSLSLSLSLQCTYCIKNNTPKMYHQVMTIPSLQRLMKWSLYTSLHCTVSSLSFARSNSSYRPLQVRETAKIYYVTL